MILMSHCPRQNQARYKLDNVHEQIESYVADVVRRLSEPASSDGEFENMNLSLLTN